MIDSFIKKNVKTKVFVGTNYELKKVRLTLDYIQDYKLLKKISKALGNFSHRKKINNFLIKNKKLIKINYYKNSAWAKKQNRIISNIKV